MRGAANGKFLDVGDTRLLVRGVTYGTFAPDAHGCQFPALSRSAADFRQMRRLHVNTVRTYTLPRPELVDQALANDLRVMVGLPWPQHLAFLDDRRLCRQIRRDIQNGVRSLKDHEGVLLFALGNEIPASIVRWHGAKRVEAFLNSLFEDAKAAAPDALMTYVNFPPTEFLDLSIFDVCAFNVYLHREHDLRAYIRHLHNIAGAKPLLLAELGADSMRNGEEGQAALTSMQLRAAFAEGAAGAIAFAWTDEWWRGGDAVHDWAFGLVDTERRPKLAATAVAQVYATAPFQATRRQAWPHVSVLVCAYNAGSTIDDCLSSIARLNYPHYDVIVIDDGSRDDTATIACRYGVKVVSTENQGLSAARNLALAHASGDIVAYTDADVRVDPDWLTYLVQPFLDSDVAGVGGPNVVPVDDPWLAQCVARSPGGPIHVLLENGTAEHVPGCNMAFRRNALLDIGGFDPIYRAAGDDVDVCWRLHARGAHIAFAASALVWHHHRPSIRAYWRQQVGYGDAESLLMVHHPDKFLDGQARWRGRIYSPLPLLRSNSRVRVNSGVWGTAAFPSVYAMHWPRMTFLPHQIQWQIVSLALVIGGFLAHAAGTAQLGELLLAPGALGLAITFGRCALYGWRSDLRGVKPIGAGPARVHRFLYRTTIAWLHFVQPLARSWGRLRGRLWAPEPPPRATSPDRRDRGLPIDAVLGTALLLGMPRRYQLWSEVWVDRVDWLTKLSSKLKQAAVGRRVDVDDGWHQDRDLSIDLGRSVRLNVQSLVEEHARGRCLVRVATNMRFTPLTGVTMLLILLAGSAAFALNSTRALTLVLAIAGLLFVRVVVRAGRMSKEFEWQLARLALECGLVTLQPLNRSAAEKSAGAHEAASLASPAAPAPVAPAEAAIRFVELRHHAAGHKAMKRVDLVKPVEPSPKIVSKSDAVRRAR